MELIPSLSVGEEGGHMERTRVEVLGGMVRTWGNMGICREWVWKNLKHK